MRPLPLADTDDNRPQPPKAAASSKLSTKHHRKSPIDDYNEDFEADHSEDGGSPESYKTPVSVKSKMSSPPAMVNPPSRALPNIERKYVPGKKQDNSANFRPVQLKKAEKDLIMRRYKYNQLNDNVHRV